MTPPPIIAGLYFYTRSSVRSYPNVTMTEIPASLAANPWYRDRLVVLAGDAESASLLATLGLRVHRVFDDAPSHVHEDAAHRMKHWMCLWALRTYGEFLWVDWDTVAVREPDAEFWRYCRSDGTPKFIGIPGYWATVNCGVYYAREPWGDAMERSFEQPVPEQNDELLWRAVLPDDVLARREFWWDERVTHVWSELDIDRVSPRTVFAHVRELAWSARIRARG